MSTTDPTRAPRPAPVVPEQRQHREGSLTQARVDALFRALVARREYERGVAGLGDGSPEGPVPPAQRTAD